MEQKKSLSIDPTMEDDFVDLIALYKEQSNSQSSVVPKKLPKTKPTQPKPKKPKKSKKSTSKKEHNEFEPLSVTIIGTYEKKNYNPDDPNDLEEDLIQIYEDWLKKQGTKETIPQNKPTTSLSSIKKPQKTKTKTQKRTRHMNLNISTSKPDINEDQPPKWRRSETRQKINELEALDSLTKENESVVGSQSYELIAVSPNYEF